VRESAAAEISGTRRSDGSGMGSGEDGEDEDAPIAETYELITSPPFRYLCSVPVIAPPPALNRTATELAKAEEARENSRASAKGWELMSVLDGHCMYFTAGWWSYSFCYGKNVVQYHALASTRPGDPPARDEKTQEYILGRVQKPRGSQTPTDNADPDGQTKSLVPPNAQLQVKGDQRFLSQRLEDGTICDLTGRPRTIEIQYHCSPGSTADRIGWIKEVTTCTYLMVVYTPRLCSDVAFQPPKETRAHPVRCRPVLRSEDEQSLWRRERKHLLSGTNGQKPFQSIREATAAAGGTLPQNYLVGTTIGGVVVGAQKYVSDEHANKLTLPRGLSRQPGSSGSAMVVEILASKKAGATKVEVMSDEELKKRDLDPKTVRKFREEMEEFAGDRGWKLKLVGTGEQAQYIGSFDDEEGSVEGGEGEGQQKQGSPAKGQKEGKEKTEGRQPAQGQDKEEEGSEEVFFKEEL
jgi:protein OS-9